MKAGVIGIGSALPEHIVTNKQFESYLDTTDEWIVRRTGIRERRHLNGTVTLTDLALEACQAALADAGREASEIDHIIVATFTPDRLMPGLAPRLAKLLGTANAGAIDVNAACAGFLYGLDQASALIESGRVKLALVVGAEALSRVTDPNDRGTANSSPTAPPRSSWRRRVRVRLLAVWLASTASTVTCSTPAATSAAAHGGQEVYRHAVERMVEATREALRIADMTVDDIDLLIVHQANQRIIDAAGRRLGVPEEKLFANVSTIANTSSASIPLALHHAELAGRLKPGDIVALAAFGGGFVWGAGIVKWKERVHASA